MIHLLVMALLVLIGEVEYMDFASDDILNRILEFFQLHSVEGFLALVPYARELLISLAIIDLCTTWVLYEGQLRMSAMINKIIKVGFFTFLLAYYADINAAIMRSFQYAGLTAAGQPINGDMLTPSSVLGLGFKAADELIRTFHSISIFDKGGLGTLIMLVICMIFILAAFFFMAIQILLTKIEFNIFATLGVILLPFGALRFTSFLFQRVVSATFSFGIKLMVMYFIAGLSLSMVANIQAVHVSDFSTMLKQSLSILTLGLLVWRVPALAANVMSGNPTFEAGNVVGGFTGAIAGTAMAGAKTLGATQGIRATYNAAKSNGASSWGAVGSTAKYGLLQALKYNTSAGCALKRQRDIFDKSRENNKTNSYQAPLWFRD